MQVLDYPLAGVPARVTVAIPAGGVGQIAFVTADNKRTEPACAVDGRPLERGAEVVIARWDRGIAIVQPPEELRACARAEALERRPAG